MQSTCINRSLIQKTVTNPRIADRQRSSPHPPLPPPSPLVAPVLASSWHLMDTDWHWHYQGWGSPFSRPLIFSPSRLGDLGLICRRDTVLYEYIHIHTCNSHSLAHAYLFYYSVQLSVSQARRNLAARRKGQIPSACFRCGGKI